MLSREKQGFYFAGEFLEPIAPFVALRGFAGYIDFAFSRLNFWNLAVLRESALQWAAGSSSVCAYAVYM